MPYVTQVESLTVPRALSSMTNRDTGETVYDHESRIYPMGTVLADDDVSPVLQELYKAGDSHVTSVLRKVSDKEAESLGGVFKVEPPTQPAVSEAGSAAPGRVLPAGAAEQSGS